jgi:hypothetical protein
MEYTIELDPNTIVIEELISIIVDCKNDVKRFKQLAESNKIEEYQKEDLIYSRTLLKASQFLLKYYITYEDQVGKYAEYLD